MLSAKARKNINRAWMALAFVLFASRCSDQLKPLLRTFLGEPAGSAAENGRSGELAVDQGSAPARDVQKTLRLASWNLEFLDLPGHGPERRSEADFAALRRYAERLDADIVAVQEVANESALARVFPAATYAYHLAARGGAQRSGFVYRRHLKVRVLPDVDALALQDLRAGADMAVRVGGHELRLLSVHLKAFCVTEPLTDTTPHCEKLRAQVPALEAWIDARAAEGGAFAVLGDFNRLLGAQGDALFHELDDADPKSLALRLTSRRTQTRCQGGRTRGAVDHIVLGGPLTRTLGDQGLVEVSYEPNDVNGFKLSDHCPIGVTLDTSVLR